MRPVKVKLIGVLVFKSGSYQIKASKQKKIENIDAFFMSLISK